MSERGTKRESTGAKKKNHESEERDAWVTKKMLDLRINALSAPVESRPIGAEDRTTGAPTEKHDPEKNGLDLGSVGETGEGKLGEGPHTYAEKSMLAVLGKPSERLKG